MILMEHSVYQLFLIDNNETVIEESLSFAWDLLMIVALVVGLVILKILLEKTLERLFSPRKELMRLLRSFLNGVFFLLLIGLVPLYFGETAWLFEDFFEIGGSSISLFLVLLSIAIIIFAYRLSFVFKNYILGNVYDKYQLEKGVRFSLNSMFHYIIMLIAVMISLSTLGIDLSTLTVFASIIGIGIGFGLQNIASNFISGLIILFERPIKVGDRVLIDEILGDIVEIKMRATVVKTLDNEHIIIPNSFFLEEKVMNRSFSDTRLRMRIPFGVSYSSDVFEVKKSGSRVAEKMGKEFPEILNDPASAVGFLDYGDSSLDFVLLIWIENPHNEMRIKSETRFALFEAFKQNKIEIPFPQRDLHVRSVDQKVYDDYIAYTGSEKNNNYKSRN